MTLKKNRKWVEQEQYYSSWFWVGLLLCNWLQVWRVWFIKGGTRGRRNMVPGIGGCFALSASVNKRPQSWHVATSIKNSALIRQQMSSWFCNLSQTILVFKCFADVFWFMYIQVKDSVVGYKKGDRLTLWKTKKLCFSNKFSHNFLVQQPGANLLIIIIKFTCFQLRK